MRRVVALTLCIPMLNACGALVSAAGERVAGDLRSAIANHTDPETVREGAPAWLLMVDAMAGAEPGNARLQAQAAQLYAAYAALLDEDPARSAILAARAREYGRAALCAQRRADCGLLDAPYAEFEPRVAAFRRVDATALYAAALGELAWIRAHADDWDAIAGLPRAQLLLERVVAVDPAHEQGGAHALLGVLHSLRPPALGGDPARGRAHFEQALMHSQHRDLMARVMYAEYYARVTYDRALHDRLLGEVLAADARVDGFTMTNLLAQRRARALLDGAGDYFFEE